MMSATDRVKADILIVEDDPADIGLIAEALENRGHRVLVARDGEEGAMRAALACPDLILLDIRLHKMNGIELCQRLKSLALTQSIPVIFMTALSDAQNKIAAFQAGAIDYVTKPLQLEEVIARVETQLELAAHRHQLEELVAARTSELAAVNDALRLRSHILDKVKEAAFLVDEAGKIHYVNQEACHRLGYTEEQLLGLSLGDIDADWPVEQQPEAWSAHCDALRLQGGMTFETHHKRRNGEIFPVEVTASYLEYEGGDYILGLVRDITERKRAERELRLLNHSLDHAFDATYLIDHDLNFRYANEAAARALGYSIEALLSMNLLDIALNVSREEIQAMMRQTRESGRFPGTVESWHRRRDGHVFPVEIGATAFQYEGETLYLTIVRDISERKQMEEAIARREQEFRSLADSSPDNIIRYDLDGRVIYVNHNLVQSLGLSSAGEMVGRLSPEPGSNGRFQALYDARDRAVAHGEPVNIEMAVPGSVGGTGLSYHQIIVVPEQDASGEIIGTIAFGRDVTAIRETALLLQQTLYNLPGLAYSFCLGVDGRKSFPYMSAKLEELYHISPAQAQLDYRAFHDFVHPDDRPHIDAAIAESAKNMTPKNVDFRLCLPGKPVAWLEARSLPSRQDDGSVLWHGIMLDVTQRKQMEEMLHEERGLFIGGPTVVFKWRAEEGWPVEYVSPNVYEQFGYSAGVLTRGEIPFASMVHPDDLERVAAEVAHYSAQGLFSFEQEYRVLHADGGERWIHDFSVVTRTRVGAVTHFHGYISDKTPQKLSEIALKQSEQRFRTLAENLPDSLIRYNLDCQATYINPRVPKALQVPVEELIGTEVFERLLDPVEVQHYRQALQRVMRTGEPEQLGITPVVPGGIRVIQISFVAERRGSGEIRGALAIGRDITQLKDIETRLEVSNTQLKEMTRRRELAREEERKHVARELHDDLGQYLTALRLQTSVLNIEFGTTNPVLAARFEQMLALVDTTKKVVRHISQQLRPAALDMGLGSALVSLASAFEEQYGLGCTLNMENGTEGIDGVSAIVLYRTLQESLTNIARHAEAETVSISLRLGGGYYVLEIRDDGKGFDPVQVSSTSFGLLGMRERLEAVSGALDIESHFLQGTCVTASIPQAKTRE